MAISEKPLYGTVDIQRRNIRTHPTTDIYVHDFAGIDGWSAMPTGSIIVDPYGSDSLCLEAKRNGNKYAAVTASRVFTGLSIGGTYTVTARVRGSIVLTKFRVNVSGQTNTAYNQADTTGWHTLSRTFMATSSTHTITLDAMPPVSDGTGFVVDKVTVTRAAWTETLSPEWVTYIADATALSIGRGAAIKGLVQETDVGIMSFTLLDAEDPLDGSTLAPGDELRALITVGGFSAPLFTGTLWDVQASYPLDKATGKQLTYTTFTATDAVAIHEKTDRNGVRGSDADSPSAGGKFSETFDQRMERLAETAQAPVHLDSDSWNPDGLKVVWRI